MNPDRIARANRIAADAYGRQTNHCLDCGRLECGCGVACSTCKRRIAVGVAAWAEDWMVVGPDGPRMEVRHVCDDCAGEATA